MAKFSIKESLRAIVIGVIFFVSFFMLAGGVSLSSETLLSPYIPFSMAALAALASAGLSRQIWHGLIRSDKFWLNFLTHVFIVTSLLSGVFYTVNYAFPDSSTTHEELVTVEKKITKTRHKSRRVSRRHYTQGDPYKVYYLGIKFEDGMEKEISVSMNKYKRIHNGDTIPLEVAKGFFRIPVILNYYN